MPRYTISIAVHNNLELTRKCLDSVFRYSPDSEVFVTDNASTDGTTEYLHNLQGAAKLLHIRKFKNTGCIEPHNAALNIANGKFFVVINNDLEVSDGWLTKLEAEFADPKVAIVGSSDACGSLTEDGHGYRGKVLEYIEGSCLMMPTALARHHGLWDSTFKFYCCEDADLSLRMREIGYKIAVADLPIHHNNGQTAKIVRAEGKIDLDGYHMRNQVIFQNRWQRYLEKRTFTKEILVSRSNGVGDVLLATPVLEAIKQKYRDSRITVMTRCPYVFARNPNVALVTELAEESSKYDLIFDLNMAYEKQPMRHIVEVYAEVCGVEREIQYCGYRPELYPSKEEEDQAQRLAGAGGPLIVCHPGPTNWEGRNWSPRNFSDVTRHFINRGYRVALVGGKDAHGIIHSIDLRGQTTVTGLAALLKESALFVGIDSSPMHVAVAADAPLVAVFGCIDPKFRLPPNSPAWFRPVVAEGVGCLGCHHYQSAPRVESECLRDRVYCMEKLTANQVIVECEKAMMEKGE